MDTRSGAVNGVRSDQSNVTLDGIGVNDQNNGYAFTSVLNAPPDSVEEFRVTTANSNADTGYSSGGQVALVTKSGTNNFHGSAYEYNRNTIFSANDPFLKNSQLTSRPIEHGAEAPAQCIRRHDGRADHEEPPLLLRELRRAARRGRQQYIAERAQCNSEPQATSCTNAKLYPDGSLDTNDMSWRHCQWSERRSTPAITRSARPKSSGWIPVAIGDNQACLDPSQPVSVGQ